MQKLICFFALPLLLAACNAKNGSDTAATSTPSANTPAPDTLSYAYKATYSSDITVPGNPVNAQKVLKVWKMFETADIQGMKPYFADSVKYDDASGMHFYGPTAQLLSFAKSDID